MDIAIGLGVGIPAAALVITLIAGLLRQASAISNLRARLDSLEVTTTKVHAVAGQLVLATGNEDEAKRLLLLLTSGTTYPPAPSNPFTPDETDRYDRYIAMAKAGDRFTPQQAADFDFLVQRYKEEHPTDPNWIGLAALGAFIVGLYLIGKRQDDA